MYTKIYYKPNEEARAEIPGNCAIDRVDDITYEAVPDSPGQFIVTAHTFEALVRLLISADEKSVLNLDDSARKVIKPEILMKKIETFKDEHNVYLACSKWKDLPPEFCRKMWYEKIKSGEMMVRAQQSWRGISDKMLIERWRSLTNERDIFEIASWRWQIIPVEELTKRFLAMKEAEWIYHSSTQWVSLSDETVIKKWMEMPDSDWLVLSGKLWSLITDEMRRERYKKIQDDKCLYNATFKWKGLDRRIIQEKFVEFDKDISQWLIKLGKESPYIPMYMIEDKTKQLDTIAAVVYAACLWLNKGAKPLDLLVRGFLLSDKKKELDYLTEYDPASVRQYRAFLANISKEDYDSFLGMIIRSDITLDKFAEKYPFFLESFEKCLPDDVKNVLDNLYMNYQATMSILRG